MEAKELHVVGGTSLDWEHGGTRGNVGVGVSHVNNCQRVDGGREKSKRRCDDASDLHYPIFDHGTIC